jgi:general secretion pathway protein G
LKKQANSENLKAFTLIELLTVIFIIALLASITIPVVETSVKRGQELELRRALRKLRIAIDDYKIFVEENKIKVDEDSYDYPPDLEILVKGIEYKDKDGKEKIHKFIRRIPKDPFSGTTEWGLLSYEDDQDSSSWGGDNVYDVYSKSQLTALDGSKYREW